MRLQLDDFTAIYIIDGKDGDQGSPGVESGSSKRVCRYRVFTPVHRTIQVNRNNWPDNNGKSITASLG